MIDAVAGRLPTAAGRDRTGLVLASASPRRQQLLKILVDEFIVEPADIDESTMSAEASNAYVERMARGKAGVVAQRYPGMAVLGFDTAVVVDGISLGKPDGDNHARQMLERLSGRAHEVLTAVCLVEANGACAVATRSTRVWFAPLPDAWVRAYVASGEPMDKAGGYAIQGAAAAWIPRIDGSYSAVVGLPLFETAELLSAAGLLAYHRTCPVQTSR